MAAPVVGYSKRY